MKQEERTPHIHADVIKAWADGYEIESFNSVLNCWGKDEPSWNENIQYRIYDPLREVKEAFERGEVIERKIRERWVEVYKGDDLGSDIQWLNRVIISYPHWEWRVKFKEEFKGDDWIIIKEGKIGTHVFRRKDCVLIDKTIRHATKQEVLNAPNYDGTATNKDFPFQKGDWVINKHIGCFKAVQYGVHRIKSEIADLVYATKADIEASDKCGLQQKEKDFILKNYLSDRLDDKHGLWITEKGDIYQIEDLDKNHLINICKLFKKRGLIIPYILRLELKSRGIDINTL